MAPSEPPRRNVYKTTEGGSSPCEKCGRLRTKAEGGTTFTVCDECWTKRVEADFAEAEKRMATLPPGLILGGSVAEYMLQALDGEVSEFAQSFESVRRILGLRAEIEALKAERDEARATKDMHKERQQEAWAEVARLNALIAEAASLAEARAIKARATGTPQDREASPTLRG